MIDLSQQDSVVFRYSNLKSMQITVKCVWIVFIDMDCIILDHCHGYLVLASHHLLTYLPQFVILNYIYL